MYKPTIGLEIHAELNTESKMFCSCKNDANETRPNINVCPICMGHPGTLPVINQEAVRKVIKTGIALDCSIAENARFDRKNYFYPDLPKGYQISQYDLPFCKDGFLKIGNKKTRIRRIHLEEDTGSSMHFGGTDYSLVSFNRAGVPLMELVTEPDLESGIEAKSFAQELQLILRYIGVSDADMEKGQMRVEVNISLSDGKKLGTKVEIKNLNSFRTVEKSVDEIKRQSKILKDKGKIMQETRGWDDGKEETFSQRIKEESHDYRYFPEPDLPPLVIAQDFVIEIKSELPELPQHKRERFVREYGLAINSADVLVQKRDLGDFFEQSVSELGPNIPHKELLELIKILNNYLTTDLQGLLQGKSLKAKDFLITSENFAEFARLIHSKMISSKIAKTVLKEMFFSGADPSHIIKEKGLEQIDSEDEVKKIVKIIIADNEKAVNDFREGKDNALQYLVGQVMSKTKGKADPEIVRVVLKQLLQ